jgi:hypothetical protein
MLLDSDENGTDEDARNDIYPLDFERAASHRVIVAHFMRPWLKEAIHLGTTSLSLHDPSTNPKLIYNPPFPQNIES